MTRSSLATLFGGGGIRASWGSASRCADFVRGSNPGVERIDEERKPEAENEAEDEAEAAFFLGVGATCACALCCSDHVGS